MRAALEIVESQCAGLCILAVVVGFATGCRKDDADDVQAMDAGSRTAPWFVDITAEAGLDFVHETGATGELHMPEVIGAGAALWDFDNDGDLDIYLTNAAFGLGSADRNGEPRNRLYRQEPDGRFVDVTASSGLGDTGYGMGVAVGDINNDGHLDIYLCNYGPDRLYRNRGDGTFEDITVAAGIDVNGWSCSASLFDYDRDGFLDLYVTQYVEYDAATKCSDFAGRRDYCGPNSFYGVPDVLLRNNGDGTFTDVSEEAGIASIAAPGLGVICADLNGDDWPDVYVANDGKANQLWINQGGRGFLDEAVMMGVALNGQGMGEAGMGVVVADFDGDADFDLFISHLGVPRAETNTFYRNLGGTTGFEDATAECGLGASSVAYTGFGTAGFDADLDGDIDLFVANGAVMRRPVLPGSEVAPPWDRYAEPNLFYLNDGTGRFELQVVSAGPVCTRVEITRALATGDIDSDGDVDLLMSNIQGPARLYRNEMPRQGHWLIVRALDPRLRRDAIGASVTVHLEGRQILRMITGGSSYLSSSDLRAHFGLGRANKINRIVVRWPDGLREEFQVGEVDRILELVRGTGGPES